MAGLRKCFRCPAEVIIAVTENGKSMPVDPDPNPSGNVVFTGEMKLDSSGRMRDAVIVLGKAATPHDPRTHFMPHWATCTGIPKKPKKARPPKTPVVVKPAKEKPAPQGALEL